LGGKVRKKGKETDEKMVNSKSTKREQEELDAPKAGLPARAPRPEASRDEMVSIPSSPRVAGIWGRLFRCRREMEEGKSQLERVARRWRRLLEG
jgi:hypothetical protein